MSIQRLPSGRYRAQVYDPATGKNVSVAKVLDLPPDESTFSKKSEAKAAREEARKKLKARRAQRRSVTVKEWADTWTSEPRWQRPKESTNIHNRERIKAFVKTYGNLDLRAVNRDVIREYFAQPKRASSVNSLRAMFSDAMNIEAGELIEHNPFAGLGLHRGTGNKGKQPPTEEQVRTMIEKTAGVAPPSFAAWLQVACYTGMRPGELDALEYASLDFEANRIVVRQQFSAKTKTITPPKNGKSRTIVMTPQAKEALLSPRDNTQWAFANTRKDHYSPTCRIYYWKAIRAAAGLTDKSLYLCTRHFAGWWLVNVLEMDSEDVAFQLGHEDGGDLVRQLYGHRDRELGLRRIEEAASRRAGGSHLRVVGAAG